MSKWKWKYIDTYNTTQKAFLLIAVVSFVYIFSSGSHFFHLPSFDVKHPLTYIVFGCLVGIYLFKD
tara:strand:+ start:338 stop:535 length:198 start_codon:yes stop_codon:yes gene_type:complete